MAASLPDFMDRGELLPQQGTPAIVKVIATERE
jgi:hypothetical protein